MSPAIRSLGTTMWMPLDASTFSPSSVPESCSTSSVHTPAAAITRRARICRSLPASASWTSAPTTRPVSSLTKDVTRVRVAARAP